jgi:glycine cleavage system H protein
VIVAGERCGEIESTKSVSDLVAPVNGEVVEVNERVVTDPALINSDPFGAGWLVRVRAGDITALLDHDTYAALAAQQ